MSWLENIETTDHLKEAATKVSHSSWDDPPEIPLLGKDEVHVWRAALDEKASDVQRLQQVLSEDEQARAGRFYFQKDREHFIIARGLLRAILRMVPGIRTPPITISIYYLWETLP